jgi:hypothetical protein
MSWKMVEFDLNNLLSGTRLQDEFARLFIANGTPVDAVMLGGLDVRARRHRYYFSPAAVQLAAQLLAQYNVIDCPEPDRKKVAILVRNESETESS